MPICTPWFCTCSAPNQMTATDETFMTSMTAGNISAMRLPARSPVAMTSALAAVKRVRSSSSRTKARTTRMPVSCSRMIWLMRSMRACIFVNAGTIRTTMRDTITSSTGTETAMSHDRPTSWRTAITMPPISSMGADTMTVADICTSICTCCTSLVLRVISDGAPNCPTSRCENATTRWKRSARTVLPMPIARREPRYTATREHTT